MTIWKSLHKDTLLSWSLSEGDYLEAKFLSLLGDYMIHPFLGKVLEMPNEFFNKEVLMRMENQFWEAKKVDDVSATVLLEGLNIFVLRLI